MMPPPAAGMASGALGDRHVVCFLGLPARGKQFMAERLCRYLTFFHGAQCEIFDLSSDKLRTDAAVGDALAAYLEAEDDTATTQLLRSAEGIDDDSLDRLKKNVDSGRIAILDSSDGFETRDRAWAGTTKSSRYEMAKHLATLRVHVKPLFIEIIISSPPGWLLSLAKGAGDSNGGQASGPDSRGGRRRRVSPPRPRTGARGPLRGPRLPRRPSARRGGAGRASGSERTAARP